MERKKVVKGVVKGILVIEGGEGAEDCLNRVIKGRNPPLNQRGNPAGNPRFPPPPNPPRNGRSISIITRCKTTHHLPGIRRGLHHLRALLPLLYWNPSLFHLRGHRRALTLLSLPKWTLIESLWPSLGYGAPIL